VSSNPLVSRGTNFAQGFEHFVEFGWDAGRGHWMPGGAVTDAFLDWVARNRDLRFFAYLHYMEPHDPYTPPDPPPPPPGLRPEVIAGQAHDLRTALQKGDPRLTPAEVGYLRALYIDEVRSWDAQLGRLITALERLGLRESTVLVVLGDHGEEFQEHGLLVHRHQLYDELLRIPLVIAGPGVVRGRIREQVQGIDLFPTIAALLGIVPPVGLVGTNLLGAPGVRPAFSETEYGIRPDGGTTEMLDVRAPPWKLIWTPALDRWQLYDLVHDPGEHDDRSAVAPEARVLAEQLGAWRRDAPLPPRTGGSDPSLGQKLRALGYVQ
jgi:arylsulfatase A-like enzyme